MVGKAKSAGSGQMVAQKGGSFVLGEAQIGRSNVGHFAADTHARQRQRRIHTGSHGQVQLWRHVVEQIGQGVVDGITADGMVIVQDQHDAL